METRVLVPVPSHRQFIEAGREATRLPLGEVPSDGLSRSLDHRLSDLSRSLCLCVFVLNANHLKGGINEVPKLGTLS